MPRSLPCPSCPVPVRHVQTTDLCFPTFESPEPSSRMRTLLCSYIVMIIIIKIRNIQMRPKLLSPNSETAYRYCKPDLETGVHQVCKCSASSGWKSGRIMYMIWHLYQLMQVPFIFLVIIVILNAYIDNKQRQKGCS